MIVRNCIADCFDGCVDKRRNDPTRLIIHRISFAADDGGRNEKNRRRWPDIQPIPDAFLTGRLVASRYRDTRTVYPRGKSLRRHWADRPGSYTGGQMPYTFVGLVDGDIDQCLPLNEIGPHAKRWSSSGLGYALAGDFRRHRPTEAQWFSMLAFCAMWAATGLAIVGHTELPNSSSDPTKECPGSFIPMKTVRTLVDRKVPDVGARDRALAKLAEIGVVF